MIRFGNVLPRCTELTAGGALADLLATILALDFALDDLLLLKGLEN
jgi:hypothetical protein